MGAHRRILVIGRALFEGFKHLWRGIADGTQCTCRPETHIAFRFAAEECEEGIDRWLSLRTQFQKRVDRQFADWRTG